MPEIDVEVKEPVEKFSWLKLARGTILNKMFVCMGAWFYLAWSVVHNGTPETVKLVVMIAFGVVTVIWMLSTSWAKFVENGKLDVSAKIGTNVDIASKIGGLNG